ncbi:glyco_hydro_56 domain-containing protein [Neolamprologus brichardi]|uniref:glyco_hydro_56 domain-containing protein n=1 Tax=Neolamprologus brichardi TaxID=32507 RepID=UPI0003EC5F99|nr:glyco_hydro_56 domain-containing protein [Neolamprologus brichardi]
MAWTEPRSHQDPQPKPKLKFYHLRTHSASSSALFFLMIAAFAGICTAAPPQPAFPPLLSGQPFIIFWGIPDSSCSGRPDPGSFGMERDSRVAVFYEDTLGNYPYFVDIDTPINGGLPQHTRLETHLQKMKQDLEEALPAPRYLGLGVLRWGEWVPQWSRSREKQALYVEASKKLLKGFFPNWTPAEVEKWSKSGTPGARLFLSSQIKEALRISSASGAEFDLPVFPLVKSVYASTNTFLSQADLVSSIGESAAMGTAGVVMWERSETKTERECQELAEFVRKVLGPYSINVTTAARLCSASLCQGRGRCVRQNPESSAYLHLPPPSTVAEKSQVEAAKATDLPDTDTKTAEPDPAETWKKDFQCQWYKTEDQDVLDLQSPKDGVSLGGTVEANSRGVTETTTTAATKRASVTEFSGSSTAGTGIPAPSLEASTDKGTNPPSAPSITVLLLLVVGSLSLEP